MSLILASVLFVSGAECKECKAPAARVLPAKARSTRTISKERFKGFKGIRRGGKCHG